MKDTVSDRKIKSERINTKYWKCKYLQRLLIGSIYEIQGKDYWNILRDLQFQTKSRMIYQSLERMYAALGFHIVHEML